MKKHVDLVGLLFMLWGGMTLVLSVSLFATGVAAALIGSGGQTPESGGRLAAGIVAAALFSLAALGLIFGAGHVWIGTRLRRFRDWARAFAVVLAVVDLVLVPLGTGLGIYALWSLLHPQSRTLFES
jgi:hypothetical protein